MTRKSIMLTALTALAIVALAAAGCATATGTTSGSSAAEPPTLEIVKPAAGETLAPGSIEVEVETTNLEFTMPSNANVAGQGHVHFTLDDQPFKMSTEPSYTFEDVAPGEHTLKAELVQNNTDPFSPAVEAEITFTVE